MHIEESRTERSAGEVKNLCTDGHFRRFAAGDGIDDAVMNEDDWMLVETLSVPELLCGDYRLHGNPLLQANAKSRLSSKRNVCSPSRLLSFWNANFIAVSDCRQRGGVSCSDGLWADD